MTDPRPEPLTAEEEAYERSDHAPTVSSPEGTFCGECDYQWPCPTARLLATLDAERARPPQPEHEDWCYRRHTGDCVDGPSVAERASPPQPEEPVDHAPGCDVFRIAESWEPYGEPRHCDCGFSLWDAKRRGVYNWTPPAARPQQAEELRAAAEALLAALHLYPKNGRTVQAAEVRLRAALRAEAPERARPPQAEGLPPSGLMAQRRIAAWSGLRLCLAAAEAPATGCVLEDQHEGDHDYRHIDAVLAALRAEPTRTALCADMEPHAAHDEPNPWRGLSGPFRCPGRAETTRDEDGEAATARFAANVERDAERFSAGYEQGRAEATRDDAKEPSDD